MIRLCDIVTKGTNKEAAFSTVNKERIRTVRSGTLSLLRIILSIKTRRARATDSFFGAVLNLSCAMQCWSTGARVSALGSRLPVSRCCKHE